jgi:hypothetical protein
MANRFSIQGFRAVLTFLLVLSLSAPALSGGKKLPINTTIFGVSIKGYDAVAYHTENRAVKGSNKYSYTWNDAKWYFVSAQNHDLFAADPERYAPQYGGY